MAFRSASRSTGPIAAVAGSSVAGTALPASDGPLLAGASGLARESLSDRLAEHLVQQIRSGLLKPGDRLPTEAQISARHAVSRSVVREAVQRVKSLKLLRSRQGSGVFVAAAAEHHALDFDPRVLESMQSVVQVAEVRRVLEGEIAALAAARATRQQLAGLRRSLTAIDAAVAAGHDGVAEDLAFHRAVGEATGNPHFGQLLGFLEQYVRPAVSILRGHESRRADFMEAVRLEHRAIVDAIAAHDAPAARRAAISHLKHGQRRLETRRPRIDSMSRAR
jgi:GntR family transcriptional repressor for pyruvate dehydrogenase complex